jgi:CubicO group peptidase (beta-lactamase class C family)
MLASGSASAEPSSAVPGPSAEALRAYDSYIAGRAAADTFSGTVLLAHKGRPVLAKAYGMADKQRSVPNRTDTSYNLASAAKPFTALAIVQLAQQGKLAFHEKLGTYLSGYPADVAGQVTIHQLLTHTSGLGPHPMEPGRITYSRTEAWDYLTTSLRLATLDFTPGSSYAYSSSGLDALGEIVATVSGQPFWDYVHQHIFAPAGMTGSAYYTRTDWLARDDIAHPYMYQADGTRVDAVRNLDAGAVLTGGSNAARGFVGAGGGGGFSTAPDLVRFALALQRGKLLEPAFTELYTSPKFAMPPRPGPVDPSRQSFQGYGLVTPIANHRRVIGHGGGIGGGNTNWSIYLDMDWVGVVLCNYDLPDFEDIITQERHTIIG